METYAKMAWALFQANSLGLWGVSQHLLNSHCPLEMRRVSNKKKPGWMDDEFKQERAKRRKLERKMVSACENPKIRTSYEKRPIFYRYDIMA